MRKETKAAYIDRRRIEIRKRLKAFLKKGGHPLTADQVIRLVLSDADEKDDFESYVVMLADAEAGAFEEAQELAMDLFNYFPRQSLSGMSFAEKVTFEKLLEMEASLQDFKDGTSSDLGKNSFNIADMAETAVLSPYLSSPIPVMRTPDKNDLYYDAMDAMSAGNNQAAIALLEQALKIDPDYVQTHQGLSAIYREIGDMKNYRQHTLKAYEETRKKFKKLPKELSWYDIDNRQYHRALFFRAGLHIEDGEMEDGVELYRQILLMSPDDNLGVRYFIAGLYAGKSMEEIDSMWHAANERQNWNQMENMVEIENRKHAFWKKPKKK